MPVGLMLSVIWFVNCGCPPLTCFYDTMLVCKKSEALELSTTAKGREVTKRDKVRPFYFALTIITLLHIAFNIYLGAS